MNIDTINKSGEGLKLMGHTIFWRHDGAAARHDELATQLKQMGLENYLPPKPSPKATLKAAVTEWANENIGSTSNKKTLIRTINKRRAKNLAYVIVAEEADFEELRLGHSTEMSVIMDKQDETLTLVTGGNSQRTEEVKQEIIKKWDSLRSDVPANELSKVLKNVLMGQGAFNLKRGVYFLPDSPENTALIGQLAMFVGSLSESAFMVAAPMVDNAAIRSQLSKALYAGVIDELNQLRQDASRLAERMMKDGEVSEKTVNVRLAKYQELREKIWQVEDAMGQAATDCKVYIDELQEIITAIEIDEDDIEIFSEDAQDFIKLKKAREAEQAEQAAEQTGQVQEGQEGQGQEQEGQAQPAPQQQHIPLDLAQEGQEEQEAQAAPQQQHIPLDLEPAETEQPAEQPAQDEEFVPMTVPIVPLEIEEEKLATL